ncbi:hypothetical protein [Paracoccus sp. PAR01]|uniref:hypothetical protein n=1 Tax=Paracoccus sp. PAR01 TaxID=2769282 RepID=UPI001785E316|nr:hypothetical protein [Paracoccus sp. PAR01]MBD9529476.1 hypothetical protein [Paracoccus sp. PAR01]
MARRYQIALKHFKDIAASEQKGWPDHQWHGEIENCDVCSRPMKDEQFMIDGPAEAGPSPMWGNICVICACKYSPKVGWGKAQLYERDGDGIWRLVAGGPPA